MRLFYVLCAVLLAAAPAVADNLAWVAMDAQINLGYTYNTQSPNGDAIYIPSFGNGVLSFGSDPGGGFARQNIIQPSWWYLYVDLNLAGITTPGAGLDLSAPGTTITFDTRFYQDPVTNSNPYADAPVFLRIYTYAADGNTYLGHRDYSIVYATQPPWNNPPYPTWTTVVVDVNASPHTDGGAFDPTNVSRIRWYGTDWSGFPEDSDDFVDVRRLSIDVIPEPSSIAALGAGLIGLLPLLRRRK